jgi:sulfide:quinone oxidoreductase
MSSSLILGGGFGGLAAADELRKLLPRDHRIVVIDSSQDFSIGATNAWVMVGLKEPGQLIHSRAALRRRNVEFVHETIRSIDPASRSVTTSKGIHKGDNLVIALGADLNLAAVPGLQEAAQHFYTMTAAAELRAKLKAFQGGRILLLIPRTPFKCPAGPYEGALLLADHFKLHPRKVRTQVAVVTVEGAPMATGGPAIGEFIKKQLQEDGVEYHPGKKTLSVDPAARKVLFDGGDEMAYDLLIAVPPHEAPAVIRQSGLAGPNGWIPVDAKTCAVAGHAGVFAIGDVNAVPLPGRFKPGAPPLMMPKAGVVAEAQGRVVARNIAAALGHGSSAEFDGKGYCYIETGDMHAIKGEGSFFDLPNPSMRPLGPDMTQFEAKKTWVADTFRRLLG